MQEFKVGDSVRATKDISPTRKGDVGTVLPPPDSMFDYYVQFPRYVGGTPCFANELEALTPQPDTNDHDYHLGYEQGYHFTKRMLPTLAGGKSADYVAGFRAGLDFQHAEAVKATEAALTRELPITD